MAQELMRPQYAQNSGGLGALAMIAQTYAGKRMRKKADESASEYAGRIFTEEQRIEAQRKAEEEAKITRERNEELARADALRAYEASREDARQAKEDERWNKSFALQERSLNASLARQNQPERRYTLADKVAEAEQALGRPLTPEQRAAIVGIGPAAADAPKPLTPDQASKGALLQNALRSAYAWQGMVVNPDGSFNDLASRGPAAEAALEQAIRPKLRAESGASISPEEFSGERSRYLGGFFSADSTNATKAANLAADLENQLRALGPEGAAMVAQLQAERAQASPQLAQPQRSNMGGGGMTPGLANAAPAAPDFSGFKITPVR